VLLSAFALYQLGKAVRNADPLVKRTAWETFLWWLRNH